MSSYKQNYTLLATQDDYYVLSYSDLIFLSLYITNILSVGVSLSFLIVGHYMKGSFYIVRDRYIDRVKREDVNVNVDDDDDDDKEDKYYKELGQLSYINKALFVNGKGLYDLRFKTVRVKSPDGDDDIIMTYNSDTGTFWYYCDNKENIKFNTLDAIARKFAIDNNCKCVCINYKEERLKAFHAVEYSAVLKQLKNNHNARRNKANANINANNNDDANANANANANDNDNDNNNNAKSVYATFKTYVNTNKNDASTVTMKKHITNRFSYKGKLSEYKPFDEKKSVSNVHVSFADFKKIQKEQEQEQEQEQES
jgi:hypothetical protein